jgi:AraC-like DNA-binding protein
MESNTEQRPPGVLKPFADILGTTVENGRLDIPKQYGKGYASVHIINEHLAMMINNFELNREITFPSRSNDFPSKLILFRFQNIIQATDKTVPKRQINATPSVQIITLGMNTNIMIPGNIRKLEIYIAIDAQYLNSLVQNRQQNRILQAILENTQPLLFEQIVYPSLQAVVNEIISESVDDSFQLFFYKVKAEELICRLLIELVKRDETNVYSLNMNDIQAIYKVKEWMLEHLDKHATIEELAGLANMSQSKLKRLFKQIFGNSIFSYFQNYRMQEATRMLKEEKLSVSEVGYQLGFSNLSHFSRIFEEHIGLKPKKYAMM